MVQRVNWYLFKDRQDLFSFAKGPLGSQSVRNYASTHVRGCGITKYKKDYCGRWKGRIRISDCYDDVELPWVDAKITNVLCICGTCKYLVCESSGINNSFILDYVVPGISRRLPKDVLIILGTALLWYICSEHGDSVPNSIRHCIQLMYHNYNNSDFEETNPVKRVPIVITGSKDQVYMDEINIEG